jgi:hypothetical protein
MFKRNEGILDSILRVTLSIVLLSVGLFLLGGLQGSVPGLIVTGLGMLPLITGLTGFCPVYVPFGVNTLEKERQLISKCMSMMAGYRQGSVGSGDPSTGQTCGPCPPSISNTRNEHV